MEFHHNQEQQVYRQVQDQHEGQDTGDVNSVRDISFLHVTPFIDHFFRCDLFIINR